VLDPPSVSADVLLKVLPGLIKVGDFAAREVTQSGISNYYDLP